MPGPQGVPGMQGTQGSGGGFYNNRNRSGGNNNGRNNNRRRRPNNQSQSQQQGSKYNQGNDFQDDAEFQPKLPSDTAPAFRFVERRGRRGKTSAPGGGQHQYHHGQSQGGARNQHPKDPLQLPDQIPQQATPNPVSSLPVTRQENITPKTLRIVSTTSKAQNLENSDGSVHADTSFSNSSLVDKTLSHEARSGTPPTLPEPVEARSKPQLEMGQDTATDVASSCNDEDEGGVPVSWSMAADAQSEAQVTAAPTATEEPTVEEPKKISIRELLDTSDIIEPTTFSKLPFLPTILVEPATPAHNKPSDIFSSPLTITKTPFNPNNPENAIREPTPVERFLKLTDVTSRYLTERLSDINYNPDLSRRLKSDFEVVETAYNALPFDRSLNPYRIIWHTLLGLKRSIELRNNDAKIVGALKQMSQTYDAVRHQALHERRFGSDQPFTPEAEAITTPLSLSSVQAVAKSGENLMDTLKWNIRGGDTNVRLYEGNGNAGHTIMGFGTATAPAGFGAPTTTTAHFAAPKSQFGRTRTQFGFGQGINAPAAAVPQYGIIGGHLKG
ncbi:hypothetical protein TWF281_001329 [Arthrobotrys megalospora]